MGQDGYIARVPAGIEDLIPVYMENRRKELAELRALTQAGSFDKVGEIAHRMIGVGTPYGFEFITSQARAIRKAAGAGEAGTLAGLLDELADYLSNVKITVE